MNITALQTVSMGSWDSVADIIERSTDSINNLFKNMFGFVTDKTMYQNIIAAVPDEVKSAISATALSLLTLFFFVGFLGKTLNLQWVTWENVLMLILQLTVAKICVDNSEWIMDKTQNAFSSMVESVTVTNSIDFIDKSGKTSVELTGRTGGVFLGFGDTYETKTVDVTNNYFYFLEETEAAAAYATRNANIYFTVQPKTFDFSPVFAYMSVVLNTLIMKAVLIVALVIMVSRYMWLTVYTVAAPLSLATFASDETKEIGKSFIKSYIGCCLHSS